MYTDDRVYDDSKVEDIESLDPKIQIHRDVDMEVVEADKAGESSEVFVQILG